MKYYLFSIRPSHYLRGKDFRFGEGVNFIFNNSEVKNYKEVVKINFNDMFDKIEKIEIEIKYEKKHNPFPNFLKIHPGLRAADLQALEFLDKHNIEYVSKPVLVLNDCDREYNLISFTNELDVVSSWKNIREDPCLNSNVRDVNNLAVAKGYYQFIVCTETFMTELKSSGLTSFNFKELPVDE
jgi:hypothetical protein